jgi:transcriptional regulator with XRE-family HTH domain
LNLIWIWSLNAYEVARYMLGERLKQERRAVRLSQKELAFKCGVAANAQRHYESGFRMPRADYLQLASAAGLDAHFILFGIRMPVDSAGLSPDEFVLLKKIRSLEVLDREALGRVVSAMCRALNTH